MNTKVNLQTILIVFMICVTVIVSTNSYAKAQIGGETNTLQNVPESEIMIDPVPGGPGFIMVGPVNFKPYTAADEWFYQNGGLYNPSTTNKGDYVVGIDLPHGASITKLTLYYRDNAATNITLNFYRLTGSASLYGVTSIVTSGTDPAIRSFAQSIETKPIVDNQNSSYLLYLEIPANASSNLLVTNIRIDYEYTVYTPTIMK